MLHSQLAFTEHLPHFSFLFSFEFEFFTCVCAAHVPLVFSIRKYVSRVWMSTNLPWLVDFFWLLQSFAKFRYILMHVAHYYFFFAAFRVTTESDFSFRFDDNVTFVWIRSTHFVYSLSLSLWIFGIRILHKNVGSVRPFLSALFIFSWTTNAVHENITDHFLIYVHLLRFGRWCFLNALGYGRTARWQ